MTPAQSTVRLLLYVAAAVLTVLWSDYPSMEAATLFEWGGMFLKAALAGVIAGRAYIDQSPKQVTRAPEP